MTLPARSIPDAPAEDPDLDPDSEKESSPKAVVAVVGLATLVVVFCGIGAAFSGVFDFGSDSASTDAPVSAAPNVDQPPKVPGTTFSDGQWLVGEDIQAGTYSVTVGPDSPGCTWERNANTNGVPSSVLESGNGAAGKALVVNIRQTDKIFQSVHCGTWQRTSD